MRPNSLDIESVRALSSRVGASPASHDTCRSVRLSCGKGNVGHRAPAPSSMQRKARTLHIGSFHALSAHEWLGSHSSLGSSQSVRLNCAKENVSRRGPARSSLRRKARTLHIELDRSTHPLPTSGLSVAARCCSSSFPLRPRHSLSLNAKARSYLASREKARPKRARQQLNRCCHLGRMH